MNPLIGLALVLMLSPAHAADNRDPLLLAQAQQRPQAKPAKKVSKEEAPLQGCVMDSVIAPDGRTWCRREALVQCNAKTGNWVNTGKRCP